MESNDVHSAPTTVEPPEPPVATAPDSPAPLRSETSPNPKTKQPRRGLTIAASILAVLVIAAGVFYGLWATSGHNSTADVKQSTATTSVTATLNKSVDDATSIMTSNINSEAGLTNTDDSNAATDASNSSATVGDSINENTF